MQREKGHFLLFFRWVDHGIVSIGQLLGPNGYLKMNLKQNVRLLTLTICYMSHEGILAAIKDVQKKLGLELKESFVVNDAPVWKCLLKNGAKGIYSCLVTFTQMFG